MGDKGIEGEKGYCGKNEVLWELCGVMGIIRDYVREERMENCAKDNVLWERRWNC